jgi:hypothetical protein
MSKNVIALAVAVIGIALEIFIATLDVWFDIPHIKIRIGG